MVRKRRMRERIAGPLSITGPTVIPNALRFALGFVQGDTIASRESEFFRCVRFLGAVAIRCLSKVPQASDKNVARRGDATAQSYLFNPTAITFLQSDSDRTAGVTQPQRRGRSNPTPVVLEKTRFIPRVCRARFPPFAVCGAPFSVCGVWCPV